MKVIVDSREKLPNHITDLFDEVGVEWKRQKLKSGDYTAYIPKNEQLGISEDIYAEICIERKMNLEEIGGNLTTSRARFKREFDRKDKDIIILIEDNNYADIIYKKYHNKVAPNSFLASLHSISAEFNVPFIFIDSSVSGVFIFKTLYYSLRNKLKNKPI